MHLLILHASQFNHYNRDEMHLCMLLKSKGNCHTYLHSLHHAHSICIAPRHANIGPIMSSHKIMNYSRVNQLTAEFVYEFSSLLKL